MEELEATTAALRQRRPDSAPVCPDRAKVAAADLAPLWFARYRIRIVSRTPLELPLHGRGAILRGAFGITLRRLVCHDMTLECRSCPLCPECPYPNTFEPSPPEGGDRLSNYSDIPRPFVFDPPTDKRTEIPAQENVEFGLTVVGRASRLVPYFVAAFQKLADEGLGPRRARFDLAEVVALGRENESLSTAASPALRQEPRITAVSIYKSAEPLVRLAAPVWRVENLVQSDDAMRTRLRLRFITPVEVRDGGVMVEIPQFGPLMRRLRDRASSLAAFFGDGPLDLDFKGVSTLADTVRMVENKTQIVAVSRRSSRTGRRHDLDGFVGEAVYEGEGIGRLMPLVRLGEVIHVGKHAAFGNGRMEVVG